MNERGAHPVVDESLPGVLQLLDEPAEGMPTVSRPPGPGLLARGEPAPRGPWATSVAIVTAWPGSPGLEELGPRPSCPRFLLASPTSTAPGGPKKGMKPSPPWVQTA